MFPNLVRNKSDGTFDIGEMESKIRPLTDPHQPLTRVVCLENTHNVAGGKCLPLSFIQEVNNNNNNVSYSYSTGTDE